MIPRSPRARSGITLTEILISILIMGIGMISLAVLFPIGLLRLQSAARLSRGTYLAESAINDLSTRNLLSAQSFADEMYSPWYNLDPTRAGWYGLPTFTPARYNPWIQDTPSYLANPYSGGVSRTVGPGLPVAYDPLWRYQTNFQPSNPSQSGYYLSTGAMEGRFASGIGFVRTDPDGGTASAHGLQRLTNFNPAVYAPLNASGTSNPVPDIFVSPEDVVFQDAEPVGQNTANSSPIVPDMSAGGLPVNDWRFTWFFTGQQSDANNSTVFEGEVVICENREFNIEPVIGPASGTQVAGVAGETVVEAIFGFGSRVLTYPSQGNGNAGFAAGATNTVLLRWPEGMDDPDVRVGGWIADVTYERTASLDSSRLGDALAAVPPSAAAPFTIAPMQRCYWYQVAKKSPADIDVLGQTGWRSMTVWTVAPLRAQTLLLPNATPAHINAALIMPSVVNVYSRTVYSR
jgi:hypothetical protein